MEVQHAAYARDRRHNFWDKIWRDREGHIVIWQMPNVWLIAWAVVTTLSIFFSGVVSDVFFWAGSALLVLWSLLEIFKGADHFRRLLGLAVLAYAVASMLNSL